MAGNSRLSSGRRPDALVAEIRRGVRMLESGRPADAHCLHLLVIRGRCNEWLATGTVPIISSAAVTRGKPGPAYDLSMATKQHKTFCAPCGATTNHVTSYGSPDGESGTSMVAGVRCAEHSELPKDKPHARAPGDRLV